MAFEITFLVLGALALVSTLKIINQYERGVKFTLGKYSGIMEPGLNVVIPVVQTYQRIDMRIVALDVPDQEAITRDNVSIKVDAVMFFRVLEAKHAVIEIEDYHYAVSQVAQTTMRDVIGQFTLDELLASRDKISSRIKEIVDAATDKWGINIEAVQLKHIELPADLKRTIGKEAEAEREKRAVIKVAEGEVQAAENISKAAKMLAQTPGALHLRTLQTLNDVSSDASNTIVFAVPLEVLRAMEGLGKK